MGLIVNVYRTRNWQDATNGGPSGTYDQITVVNVPGPFEPTDDRPAFLLTERAGNKILVPAVQISGGGYVPARYGTTADHNYGPMNGGNFAGGSDERWAGAVGFYGAVPIHDRFETRAQYDALSR